MKIYVLILILKVEKLIKIMNEKSEIVESKFVVLDVDYVYFEQEKKPIVRVFGKEESGKTVCALFKNYFPYFYVDSEDTKVLDGLNILKYEFCEKFLPIGYSEKKKKVLKVYLNNPADVPKVREKVKAKTYEADILFRNRFMVDHGIKSMNTIRVVGKEIKTNSLFVDKVIEVEKFEVLDEELNVSYKFLTLDIECLNPPKKTELGEEQIIMISLVFYPPYKNFNTMVLVSKIVNNLEDKDVICFESEEEMLRKFLDIIKDYQPDFIVGYNINNFDLPYLIARMKKLKIKPILGRSEDKSASSKKIAENKYKNHVLGRVIIDSYKITRELSSRGFYIGLKRFGLGDVAKFLINEEKIDIPHSLINQYWYKNPKELINYSRKDAELAFKIFLNQKMLEKYIALSKVTGLLLQDVIDGGEAQRIEFLLLQEFKNNDILLPNKPSKEEIKRREEEKNVKELKGGLVLNPQIGFHDKCVVYLDFASMYPNIIISFNICPTTIIIEKSSNKEIAEFVPSNIREGIYPKILKRMINERKKVKDMMKNVKDERLKEKLDAMQEAFKRVANAFYGYTGFVGGRIYILEVANSITAHGRKLISEMKNEIETKTNYKVIYGDTDSIMVKLDTDDLKVAFQKAKELENYVNSKYENLKMKLENIFETLIIVAKKRYAGLYVDENGNKKIVMKGIETVRRDWCDLVTETLREVLRIILTEKNIEKAVSYFKKVAEDLRNGKIPIEKLTITKGVSKKDTEYKGIQPHIELIKKMKERGEEYIPGVGDRVSFVIIKGREDEKISLRAEDPKYVLKNNLEIDYRYYLETQLLNPMERLFEAIGVTVSDLRDIGKQATLTLINNNNNGKKKTEKLEGFEFITCERCGEKFKISTLSGRCDKCGSELYFYNKGNLSKFLVFRTL